MNEATAAKEANITVTRDGHLAYIRLASMTMTPQFIVDFAATIDELEKDIEVRVILLLGHSDKVFFAGYNLELFQSATSLSAVKGNVLETQEAMDRVEQCSKPVIAIVDGYALGAGFELILACDLAIASDRARFGFPETRLGLIPAAGGTMRLPRRVGKNLAMEIILTGNRFTARQALEMGLVNRVVSQEELLAEAEAIARSIACNAPRAVRMAKKSIMYWETLLDKQVTMVTLENVLSCLLTEDLQEGVRAFLEKRAPVFQDK
ncbi:MAG: enoyl-CoA hydratase/isomerase family protein [Solirubrobacterales bacterium]